MRPALRRRWRFVSLLTVLVLLATFSPLAAGAAPPETAVTDPYDLMPDEIYDYAPATPTPIEVMQPDGTTFMASVTPQEIGGQVETADEYTVVKDGQGYWNYATTDPNSGELVPSGLIAGKDLPKGLEKKLGRTDPVWLDENGNDKRQTAFDAIHDLSSPNGSLTATAATEPKVYHYAVVLVEFQDVKFKPEQTPENFQNQLTGFGVNPTGTLTEFYMENSYGKFQPMLDVYGPFTSDYNMAWYDNNAAGGHSISWMMNNDIGPKVANLVNWDEYDNDRVIYTSQGQQYRSVDMVVVIHAGTGQEATGRPGEIWSHASTASFVTGQVGADGLPIRIRACNTEPADGFNIGVVCHEMGHSIGESDYYATNYRSAGTGDWDLMAGGSWMGNQPAGSNPTHMNPFSKIHQGWVIPTILTETTTGIELQPRSIAPSIVKIPLGGSGRGSVGALEDIYVEYISNQVPGALFDKAAPASGLLVWHYDQGGSQNNAARYAIAIEEYGFRDGEQDMRLNFNRGEPTDPWFDTAIGMTPLTSPNTNRDTPLVAGGSTVTGWSLVNISDIGPTMTFDAVLGATGRVSIDRPRLADDPIIAGQGPATITASLTNNTDATLTDVAVGFYADGADGQPNLLLAETVLAEVAPDQTVPVEATWENPVTGKYTVRAQIIDGAPAVSEAAPLRVFARPAPVLIVDDDDGFLAQEAYEGVLTSLGVPYVLATRTASLATMQQYDLVIWHAGQAGRQEGQLTRREIADLKAYLNGGGQLWLASPRLGAAMASTGSAPGVDPAFYADYFGAHYPMSSQAGGGTIIGLGNPIGGTGSYDLRAYPGREIMDFIQIADSSLGTVAPLFNWSLGDYMGTEVRGDDAHGNFHVVYFGFCLSQVISGADRLALTSQVLDTMNIASVAFDDQTYLMQGSGAIKLSLHDPLATTPPEVTVTSQRDPVGVTVKLLPSKQPGDYEGILNIHKNNSQGNSLHVNDTDVLTAYYTSAGGATVWATADVKLKADQDMPAAVYHDNIFCAVDAQPLEVTAVVTDDIGVRDVALYYRVFGDTAFTKVDLESSREFRNVYSTVLPGDVMTELGIEYYIVAHDSKGNITYHGTADDPQYVVVQPRTIGQ